MKTKSILMLGLSALLLVGCNSNKYENDISKLNIEKDPIKSTKYANKYIYTGYSVDQFKKKYDSVDSSNRIGILNGTANVDDVDIPTYTAYNLLSGVQIGTASKERITVETHSSTPFVKIHSFDSNYFNLYFMDGTLACTWNDIDPQPTIQNFIVDDINTKYDEKTDTQTDVYIAFIGDSKFSIKYQYNKKYGSKNYYNPQVSFYHEQEIFVNHTPNITHPTLIWDDATEEDHYVKSDIESYFYTKNTNWTGDITMYEFFEPGSNPKLPNPEPVSSLILKNDPKKDLSYTKFTFFGDYLYYTELVHASEFNMSSNKKKGDYKIHQFNIKKGEDKVLGNDLYIYEMNVIKDNNGKHSVAIIKGNESISGSYNTSYRGVKYLVNDKMEILGDLSLTPFQNFNNIYKLADNRYFIECGNNLYVVDKALNIIADVSKESGHMSGIQLIPEEKLICVSYADEGKTYYATVTYDGVVNNNVSESAKSLFNGTYIFDDKYLFTNKFNEQCYYDLKTNNQNSLSWKSQYDYSEVYPSYGVVIVADETVLSYGEEQEKDCFEISICDFTGRILDKFENVSSRNSIRTVKVDNKLMVIYEVFVKKTVDEEETVEIKKEIHSYSLKHH